MTQPLRTASYLIHSEIIHPITGPSEVFAHPATKQLVDVNYNELAAHLGKQQYEHEAIQKHTQNVFSQVLDKLQEVSIVLANEYMAQVHQMTQHAKALEQTNTTQKVRAFIDSDRSVGILNVLWHSVCFFQRGNIRPMAIQPPGVSNPILAGRVIACLGDYNAEFLHQPVTTMPSTTTQAPLWLEYEIASLFVPAQLSQPFYIATNSGKTQKWHTVDTPFAIEHFISVVLESVVRGGTLHE